MQIDTSVIRKLAKARGLKLKFSNPIFSFYEGGECRFSGEAEEARSWLKTITPQRRRGRPQGYKPEPRPKLENPLSPRDYVRAKRSGGYTMKVEGGIIRLWAGRDLVFESRDVERLRLYFSNAENGLVPVAPEFAAKREAKRLAALAKARLADERARAREQRKLEASRRRRRGRPASSLARNDPGLESRDFTPASYQGLMTTDVLLPEGFTSDSCLIGLWAAENHNPWSPAKSVLAKIGEAQAVLAGRVNRVEITLSDHDRASLQRYPAPMNVTLTAAALARARQRGRVRA